MLTLLAGPPAVAQALPGDWSWEVAYTADAVGVKRAGEQGGRLLDNLDLIADGEFDHGLRVHAYVLNNSGGAPNDLAGTLQGVDNIEVARPHLRLYEFWVEQALPDDRFAVLAGLYDLNSEFYSNEAAGLLIAPPFGIGSELAATGPNGPSIFPSTSLAVRLKFEDERGPYAQAAVLNAKAGVPGDPGGVDVEFEGGALYIAEAGWRRDGSHLGFGAWRYGDDQDDIRDVVLGAPAQREAAGLYVLGEHVLREGEAGRTLRGFFRAGASDGDTTPFKGGWQAGVLVERPFAGRPDSAFSVGLQQGILSDKYRANAFDAGLRLEDAESGVEVTYADKLGPVTIQPSVQYIPHPAGEQEEAWVVGLRFGFSLASGD